MEITAEMFTRSLRCPLTSTEVHDRGTRLASIVGKLSELRSQMAEEMASRKAVIKEKEGERDRLATETRDQATFRDVDCERILNYTAGTVVERRLDTGEEISSRPMTFAERQLSLGVDDPLPSLDPVIGNEKEPEPEPAPKPSARKALRAPKAPKGRVKKVAAKGKGRR